MNTKLIKLRETVRWQKLAPHLCYVAVVIFTAILMIFLYGTIEFTKYPYLGWDLTQYRQMAQAVPSLATDVRQPFVFRLLAPYLVGLLPLTDVDGFRLLSLISTMGLATLFYFFLLDVGLEPKFALLGVLFLLFNKLWWGFLVWDYFQLNDTLTYLCILVCFLAIRRGQWLLFGSFLWLGGLAKEVAVLVAPATLVYLWEQKRLQREGKLALFAAVPCVATLIALRLLIDRPGNTLYQSFLIFSPIKVLSLEAWFRQLINAYVPFTFLPIIFYKDTLRFFSDKKFLLLFTLSVYFSTFFGIDSERLLMPLFLVFYWLISSLLQMRANDYLLFYTCLLCSFFASFHHEITRFSFLTKTMSWTITLGTLVLVALVACRNLVSLRTQRKGECLGG